MGGWVGVSTERTAVRGCWGSLGWLLAESGRREHWAAVLWWLRGSWRCWARAGAGVRAGASDSCVCAAPALPLPAVGLAGDLFAGARNVQGVELHVQESFWVLGVHKNKDGGEWRKPQLNSRLTTVWCKIYVKFSSPIPKLTDKSVCSH